jgi:hypothetical protein
MSNEMKVIMERWSGYTKQQLYENTDLRTITTIGQLKNYFAQYEPSRLQKIAGKYGKAIARIFTGAATIGAAVATAGTGGAATPLAAAGAAGLSMLAESAVENLLLAALIAFSDIEDGSYKEGTAASYFDLNDHLQIFLRDIETKGKDMTKFSVPEREVFEIMKEKINNAVTSGTYPESTLISDLLEDVTSQSVLELRLKNGEYSGKVKLEPV